MDDLLKQWKQEEQEPFEGWDFSHLNNRMISQKPPWDYIAFVRGHIKASKSLLDVGTGGGERLQEIGSLPAYTAATEGWHPNYLLANKTLEPRGVDVREAEAGTRLPFEDETFDLVINRHTDASADEVVRVLQPGGLYITQQVGGDNMQDLLDYFGVKTIYPEWNQAFAETELQKAGFNIIEAKEWHGKEEFKDVGAIVYYLKAIPWSVPDFSVERNKDVLITLQNRLENGDNLRFSSHRFLIKAQKS